MNNIEILEEWLKEMDEHFKRTHINNTKKREALRFIIQENKELKEKVKGMYDKSNKLIEVTNLYLNSIPKLKVKEKIEEINKRIDYLDKELAEAYIQREKLGSEIELDTNEQYIYNMEQERSIRHTEKYAYLKLLEGE